MSGGDRLAEAVAAVATGAEDDGALNRLSETQPDVNLLTGGCARLSGEERESAPGRTSARSALMPGRLIEIDFHGAR